ncbi:alpha/beta hydrolase [Rhodopirellula sp. SWK7]|uniref:alpha/beta hydrolase n=1 Tax=Rhodopirellula sp. SWK7 TaxID=595460 RepID=UPI0002BFEDE6|nr:alpha/beta hydrolase [Rhodopirellula sp. SWK7]EMI45510.1 lipase/esterase [Rhodopirellula sp. SWK7]
MRSLFVFLCLSATCVAGTPASSPEKELAEFKTVKDIVFKTVDGQKLDMLLFLPKERQSQPMPVMLYTHGGGWRGGNKYAVLKSSFVGTLRLLLERGIACATIKYRLSRVGKATAFDSVVDCKDAARFLVKNAELYHFDPERIGVWGGSAGGHLSLMTGLAPGKLFAGDPSLEGFDPTIRCIASYYPATSFIRVDLLKGSAFEDAAKFTPILGGPYEEKQEMAKLLSPVEYLTKSSPPVLILHGDNDTVLPIATSQYMLEVAEKIDANVEMLVVKDGGHSFKGNNLQPTLPEIQQHAAQFIIRHLKPEP